MNLNMNKATGSDNISPVVLKICCRELMTSICLLCNRSLTEGIVPQAWRMSNGNPVFKVNVKLTTTL